MAKKRKTKAKARKTKKLDVRAKKKARDEKELLKLPHGVITGAYAGTVEQMHPDGYDEEKIARRARKAKAKRKSTSKAGRKSKARKAVRRPGWARRSKVKAAPKRKLPRKVRHKK